MNNYIISCIPIKAKVISEKEKESYEIKPSNNSFHVKKIIVFDEDIIGGLVRQKINKEYRRLIKILYTIINSDDATDSDFYIAFEEIDRVEQVIMEKYGKILGKKNIQKFLKKLNYLKLELGKYSNTYKRFEELEERVGKGR